MDQGSQVIVSAGFDAVRRRVLVRLENGLELAFPASANERMRHADAASLSRVDVTPSGQGLHWPDIDEDLSLAGILAGRFGRRTK